MDSQLWHEYCAHEEPHEPEPLTASQWNKLNGNEREDRIDRLSCWLANVFVPTPEADTISAKMTKAVAHNAYSPPGAKRLQALTGRNFVGKSTLMMRWARERYREWTSGSETDEYGRPIFRLSAGCEADLCPVVWIDLRAAATIKDVAGEVLDFFGLPSDGATRRVSEEAINAIHRHKARVVIIDDVHLLKTNWKGGRDVLDYVKHLNTRLGKLGVSLILVGANLGGGDLANDPQIASRLRLVHLYASPREVHVTEEMRAWQIIVRHLENRILPHLPRGRPEMLFTKLAQELHDRTQGYLGDVTELVAEATIEAIRDGTYRIQRKHLDRVELSKRAEEEYRDMKFRATRTHREETQVLGHPDTNVRKTSLAVGVNLPAKAR